VTTQGHRDEPGHNGAAVSRVTRAARAFGVFWWEFLIGDTPELFLAVLAVIGLAFALHGARVVGVPVVMAAVLGFLGVSVWRGRKRPQR
jgi:hypothetical protein